MAANDDLPNVTACERIARDSKNAEIATLAKAIGELNLAFLASQDSARRALSWANDLEKDIARLAERLDQFRADLPHDLPQ